MPSKCDFCGEKVVNGVCTGCGMDYNRASSASADYTQADAYKADEQPKAENASQENNNEDDMFRKALEDGLKNSKTLKKRGTIIAVLLITVISAVFIGISIYCGTFFEDSERETARKAEQAITERPRMSIPEISIPHVNIPKITVPDVDMGEDFQKALDHDIQAIIKQNGIEKE